MLNVTYGFIKKIFVFVLLLLFLFVLVIRRLMMLLWMVDSNLVGRIHAGMIMVRFRNLHSAFSRITCTLIWYQASSTYICEDCKVIIEPLHEIFNNVVSATSKASDQPVHTRSLIRAFASRLNII